MLLAAYYSRSKFHGVRFHLYDIYDDGVEMYHPLSFDNFLHKQPASNHHPSKIRTHKIHQIGSLDSRIGSFLLPLSFWRLNFSHIKKFSRPKRLQNS